MRLPLLIVAVLAIALSPGASFAQAGCPSGTYPMIDQWGQNVCKRMDAGTTSPPAGSFECPPGTAPTVDSWGNRACRALGRGGSGVYDPSRGCPAGFYEWVDRWGNATCRRR